MTQLERNASDDAVAVRIMWAYTPNNYQGCTGILDWPVGAAKKPGETVQI